jgi:hypothetical protein
LETIALKKAETELAAAVYRPNKEGRSPGMLVAPGGLARGDLDAYRWAGERLAAAGYVTMVTTYSTSSPRADSADLTVAVDWLAARSTVDSSRLVGLRSPVLSTRSETHFETAASAYSPLRHARFESEKALESWSLRD